MTVLDSVVGAAWLADRLRVAAENGEAPARSYSTSLLCSHLPSSTATTGSSPAVPVGRPRTFPAPGTSTS